MLGTVKLGNQFLCEDVPVWLAEAPLGGEFGAGGFEPDPGSTDAVQAAFEAGETCRIYLDDGRSGDIQFSKITGTLPMAVEFIVTSELM